MMRCISFSCSGVRDRFSPCFRPLVFSLTLRIHAYIDNGIPPPNSPITLSGGWMRNPVSKKPVKVKGKSGTTPLVDTGQLYNDFDWEIASK